MKERDCGLFEKIHSFFHQKNESYLSSHSSSGFPSKKSWTFDRYRNLNWRCRGMKILNESRKRTVCKSTQRPRHVRSLIAQPTQQLSGPRWLKRLGLGGEKNKRETSEESILPQIRWFSESEFPLFDFQRFLTSLVWILESGGWNLELWDLKSVWNTATSG